MTLDLTLHTAPAVPLEAEVITPARLAGLSPLDAARLTVVHGNQSAELGEFFRVDGAAEGEIHLSGDLARVKLVGAGMADGRIVIHGPAGMHLGVGMSGGEIVVEGNAGDWVGAEMTGGRIVVRGDAGHMIGAPYRGARQGMTGGEILVFGNAGNEAGSGMRRGLVAIAGDSGDFTGVNMLAGTIAVLGQLGWRPGAGMRRGTIVSMHPWKCCPRSLRVYLSPRHPPPVSSLPSRPGPSDHRGAGAGQLPTLVRRRDRAQPRRDSPVGFGRGARDGLIARRFRAGPTPAVNLGRLDMSTPRLVLGDRPQLPILSFLPLATTAAPRTEPRGTRKPRGLRW
jgi:formylmethanofuran dehydrogenase subunit C